MKNFRLVLLLFAPLTGFSQYYFNDIVDARMMSERMENYAKQNVRTITATGFDARGAKSTDFNEWQEISPDKKTLKVTTRNGQVINRQSYHFDSQNRLVSMTDSARDIKSITTYAYDEKGNIVTVKTTTNDSLQDFSETVEHRYVYNASGNPERLWRIVNAKDSSEYRFTIDNNHVADEQLVRRSVGLDPVYYYYNDQGRITDIVRYNKKAKRLLPSQMFEYDDAGRVIQKMTILSTDRPDYVIWRYVYDAKGLKTKEALFNKQKELTGRIDYAYTFQ